MREGLRRWLYRLPVLVVVIVAVLLVRHQLLGDKAEVDRFVQRVRLLDPPPPPPPKPLEEPTPVVREEIKIKTPEPDNNADAPPAMDDRLGLDAEGGGSDAFGLAAKKGGKDLLATATIGGDGARFRHFASQIERSLERALARDPHLRGITYNVVIRLWLDAGGGVERLELSRASGNAETDDKLRRALSDLNNLGLTPPEGLPQPVRLQVTSRLSG